MSQKNADPQKVEELIKRLHSITEETIKKQKQLKNYVKDLESHWNDHHYKAFAQQFQEFDQKLIRTIEESRTVMLPNLKNVKKLAEDYKNGGRR
jgi:uncharacterized protein YukE